MQFTKGASGNPAGRPKGIKDKRHRFNEAIESMIPQVLDSVFQKAVAGDVTAAKMLLDRSLPTSDQSRNVLKFHTLAVSPPTLKTCSGAFWMARYHPMWVQAF